MTENIPEDLKTVLLRIEARLAAIQGELQQAQQERSQLFSLLTQLLSVYQPRWPSTVGMDYSQLEQLLATGNWREADEYTWLLMLAVAGTTTEGWLTLEDIANYPCTDLKTLDALWLEYSGGRFGLTVQQQILDRVQGDYPEFCDRLSWRIDQQWLYYDQLTFSLDAPVGHLPVLPWRKRACYGVGSASAAESLNAIITRLTQCSA